MCVRTYRFPHNCRTVEVTASSEYEAKEAFYAIYSYWPQESVSSVAIQEPQGQQTNYDEFSWAPYV